MSTNLPISEGARQDLLDIDGVVSVGLGFEDGREVIAVGVETDQDASEATIPDEIEGFPTIVDVEGRTETVAARLAPNFGQGAERLPVPDRPVRTATGRIERIRPIQPGISIGHTSVTAGTAGFLATDGDRIYMISNNHIVVDNDPDNIGTDVVQPGVYDGGDPEEDAVGAVTDFIEVEDVDNALDVGWFEPEVESTEDVLDVGVMETAAVDPEIGETVTVSGRTSGVFEAVVDRVSTTVLVGDPAVEFVDQFRLDTPLKGGDSGAPVSVDLGDGPVPAGLGFATTDTNGFCNYATNIESATGLTILNIEDSENDNGNGNGNGNGENGNGSGGLSTGATVALLGGLGLITLRERDKN